MNCSPAHLEIVHDSLLIAHEIGRGGQAIVYAAELDGQKVAVKDYGKTRKADEALVSMMARLQHKNIVRLIGFCATPRFCLVLERCETNIGISINSERLITRNEFTNWSAQIACGMAYLHRVDVIHRDLKPANVLLGIDGGIRICDFDLSKTILTPISLVETVCGTVLWMAPEVLKGQKYTRKIDVWSFGVLLWQIITQQMPYNGCREIIAMLSNCRITLPMPSKMPQPLCAILRQCLNHDVSQRTEFSLLYRAIRDSQIIDERKWMALKQRWRTEVFSYVEDANGRSHLGSEKFDLEGTCRRRHHCYDDYSGPRKRCDLCSTHARGDLLTCKSCQQICHSHCSREINFSSNRTACIPRPAQTFNFETIHDFDYCPVAWRISHVYPQIPHHMLYGIFELERRQKIFRFTEWNETFETQRVAIMLRMYNRRRIDDVLTNEIEDVVQRVVWHIKDNAPEPGVFCTAIDKANFLCFVEKRSVADIKKFIQNQIDAHWQSIAAIIFTNWLMFGAHEVDEWSIHCVTTFCLGVVAPQDMWSHLREVMLKIEFDFWNRFLVYEEDKNNNQ